MKNLEKNKDVYGDIFSSRTNHDRYIFAFDLHRVIIHRSIARIIAYCLAMANKRAACQLLLNRQLWKDLKKIRSSTEVSDDIYDQLLQKHPDLELFKQEFIDLENTQQLDYCLYTIIKHLKSQGHILYLLSNIGPRAYKDLKTKLPHLFDLFDDIFIPQAHNNFIQKPNPLFYKNFLSHVRDQSHNKAHRDVPVIFIDDKLQNILPALSLGISGIHFKSASQLATVLKHLRFGPF